MHSQRHESNSQRCCSGAEQPERPTWLQQCLDTGRSESFRACLCPTAAAAWAYERGPCT